MTVCCLRLPPRKLGPMKIYRSALLRFADDGQAVYDSDALLAVAADAAGVAADSDSTVNEVPYEAIIDAASEDVVTATPAERSNSPPIRKTRPQPRATSEVQTEPARP